jgi:hypothetical protein
MKKLIISFAIIIATLAASAQVAGDSILRSKKGIPILPKKGDIAIGIDAIPYFNYLGNMFNGTSNNTLNLGSTTLFGKYYLEDNVAIRAAFSIDNYNNIQRAYIQDDQAVILDPLSNAQTEDSYKQIQKEYSIDLAYQIFRGYGRLRGFYGIHAGYEYYRYKTAHTYGNPITGTNQQPTIYAPFSSYDANGARELEYDGGISHSIFGGILGGIEYYFLPKICIGGEITLSGTYDWSTQGNTKSERWNGTSVIEEDIASSPSGRTSSSLYTYRPIGGGIYLMFHF